MIARLFVYFGFFDTYTALKTSFPLTLRIKFKPIVSFKKFRYILIR